MTTEVCFRNCNKKNKKLFDDSFSQKLNAYNDTISKYKLSYPAEDRAILFRKRKDYKFQCRK